MRFPQKLATKKEQQELEQIIQVDVKDCYQCAKCTAGCPLTEHMDYYPHQIMLMAKMGLYEKILASKTLWVCASCLACSSRCPRDLDPAKILEGFRTMLVRTRGHENLGYVNTKGIPRQAMIAYMRKNRR